MELEKAEKMLKMAQILKENPDINPKELARRLNMNLRTIYRYLKQFQQIGMPVIAYEKGQHILYDEIDYLNLALTQPQLSLIHKSVEAMLLNPKELNESELQILKQVKELISKATWIKSEAAPASINFLFEPTKGRYDGEVSIGLLGDFERLNPLDLVSSINISLLPLIFSTLFSYPKEIPEGLLVKSWEVSDDLLTWTFELKEGVKFHDGKELTAEDVEFTYRSIIDAEYGPTLASIYSFISGVEAISKYKFQIRLKNPYTELLYMLGIPILPKEVLQRHRQLKSIDPETLLIGSGPFKFDSFPQLDTMILKANENYFEEGYPHLERVILKAYPTSRDLYNACASGEIDVVMFGLSVSELEQLGKTISFQVYPIDMHAYYALLFNLKDETFSDIRVRKAISHAIDRETLIRRQLRGYGSVLNSPLPPSSWAHNKNLQLVKYDIELAKSLLVEAGWQAGKTHWQKDGKELEMEIAVNQKDHDSVRLAIGLRLQLSKLKVKVKLRYINPRDLGPNSFETALLSISSGGDPGNILRKFWHSSSKINLTSYHNPEVDELLDWGRSVVSIGKRKAIYDKVQDLIVSDYPAAFLCTAFYFIGSNCTLQNATDFLRFPALFLSIKSWTIKRGEMK